MLIKFIVIILLLVIIYSLGSALFFMLSKKKHPEAMAKALTWRIALSLTIFFLLLLGFAAGWIKPHGISKSSSDPSLVFQQR